MGEHSRHKREFLRPDTWASAPAADIPPETGPYPFDFAESAAGPGTGQDQRLEREVYADAVSTYNREQSLAFGRYRAECDHAWLAYLGAMHAAEMTYEKEVAGLGAAFAEAMDGGKISAPES